MVELDGYLEGLYDDLPAKIRATGLILQLARVPENLLELSSNGRGGTLITCTEMIFTVQECIRYLLYRNALDIYCTGMPYIFTVLEISLPDSL